jgi:serine/threonine protein kinase
MMTITEDRAQAAQAHDRLTVVRGARQSYRLGRLLARGDISNVYASTDPHSGEELVLKVLRHGADSDLLEHERAALVHLHDAGISEAAPFFSRVVDTGAFSSFRPASEPKAHPLITRKRGRQNTTHGSHPALVLTAVPNTHTLVDIRERFADGLPLRHMAWVFRRLLTALGFIHSQGMIHGAILPENLLIEPAQHGLIVIDFKAASLDQQPIAIISRSYRAWYPPEVLEKRKPVPGTDFYMAARCMEHLIGGHDRAPLAFRAFFKHCTQRDPHRRPRDAWELLEQFNTLTDGMWGPRTFIPLDLPTTETQQPEEA